MMCKKILISVLIAVMLLSLAACSSVAAEHDTANNKSSGIDVSSKFAKDLPDHESNLSKTLAVAVVKEKSEGPYHLGSGIEGFPETGKESQLLTCDVLCFYNYSRIQNGAYSTAADYILFRIGGLGWLGKSDGSGRLMPRPEGLFSGELTEEFLEKLRERNIAVTYDFYVDWEYRNEIQEGDIILLSADLQLTINLNKDIDEKYNVMTVSPFGEENQRPYLAKFVDGKLLLPAELQDAFVLHRLYYDTEPQLTSIKAGDSVEDVVAFLKAVEQDMARYEEEQKQQPRPIDVSSIR